MSAPANSKLAEEDFALVSGLFVRAGIYVSHCEDTDHSEESEEEEKSQMLRALKRIAGISKVPLISAAAIEAISALTVPENETSETLDADIRKAVQVLKTYGDAAALVDFKKALMYVANSVARAYREELDYHEDEFILESFLSKIAGALNRDSDPEEFKNMNISPAEDTALTLISEALRS